MFLRKFRFLSVALLAAAAFVASPSRSDAAVEVLIVEIGPGGPTTLFNSTVAANGQVTTSSSSFSSINLQFGNSVGALSASFTTGYTITPTTGLDVSTLPSLSITVRDTGPAGNGITAAAGSNATLSNNVSGTTGILTTGSSNSLIESSTFLNNFAGSGLIASTGPDSVNSPGFDSSSTSVSGLSSAYTFTQTISINVTGNGTIEASTLGGSVSSTLRVDSAPVPAPPAALLAALALPVFGVRRYLGRNKA